MDVKHLIDEFEAGLVAQLIESSAGFIVRIGLIEVGRDKQRYYVSWDEYRNPHDNHCKCETEFLWFDNPKMAAKCFIDLRRTTFSGDDFEESDSGYYLLGGQLEKFKSKWDSNK